MSNLEIGLTIWSIYSMLMWWYWERKCRNIMEGGDDNDGAM
jgi:hypothetical protein